MKKTLLATLITAVAAPLTALAAPATYAIDPTHTSVMFEVLHMGTSTNRGRFVKSAGTVQLDTAAKTGKVELTLDMTGITTGVAPFDKHLKGSDFFDVDNHPTAQFVGSNFTFNGDKPATIAGTLTMRGQTHPVTLEAVRFNCYDHPMLKREVCGGDFKTSLERSQWGMTWGLNFGVADETPLTIQVEAIKQ